MDKAFLSFLGENGVTLQARGGAKRKGKVISLPVSGGEIDPLISRGTIEQEGTLLFKRGRHSVPLKKIVLKTKSSPIQAKVGGNQLKVARAKSTSLSRSGFGTVFRAKGLTLSAKAATRIAKKLHLGRALKEGQPIGSLTARTQPATTTILPRGRATLALDPAFVAKLDSLFVSLNPISPAELAPGALLGFPLIPGGTIAPDASTGTLRTGGSVELLQQGAGQLFEHELWFDLSSRTATAEVDIQPAPTFPGKLGRIGVFAVGAGQASSDPGARTISLSAAPLGLDGASAAYFNQAFAEGKPTFAAGERFGALSFTAQGQ